MEKLTPKQMAFCLNYVELGNASLAYRYAYDTDKMKPETVNRCAFELLNNRKVTTRIEELLKQNESMSEIKRADILKRLKTYFNFDIRNIMTIEKGIVTIKDSKLWDKETAMCIESVDVGKDGNVKLSIVGKQYTINRLCTMCGFDAPAKRNLNINDMTDEEIERIAEAIVYET